MRQSKRLGSCSNSNPITCLGMSTSRQPMSFAGREEEARSEAAEVMRIDPQFSLERWAKMFPFRQELVDQLVEAWRKAGLK